MTNIRAVVNYLNETYTQQSVCEDCTIKIPKVEEWNDAIIVYWTCGAIVRISRGIFFVDEDDMHWTYGRGCSYPIAYLSNLTDALLRLKDYMKRHYPNVSLEKFSYKIY